MNNMSSIQPVLKSLFKKHRIVFWYDPNGEMRDEYEQLELDNVKNIEINNNEFGIKYRLLKQESNTKFLIYSSEEKPSDIDNWLLDLNLSYYVFRADIVSMTMQELGLPIEWRRFIYDHIKFFNNKNRTNQLKSYLQESDNETDIALKMLAVLTRSDPEMEYILYKLFAELDQDNNQKYEDIKKYGLDAYFWKHIKKQYGYHRETPSLKDFFIYLIKNRFNSKLENSPAEINENGSVFINHWMNHVQFHQYFQFLSDKISKEIDIHPMIKEYNYRDLLGCDVYRAVDQKIIYDLKNGILNETIGLQTVEQIINKRKILFWYSEFKHIYSALYYAAQIKSLIKMVEFEFDSLGEGISHYVKNFYRFDFAYRKYIFNANQAEYSELIKDVTDIIEKIYSNSYLLKINNQWQQLVDEQSSWVFPGEVLQSSFYNRFVEPFVSADTRIFIIISDGLRYETGKELNDMLQHQDRYQSNLTYVVGSLPSYTQLGMATLLPHKKLTYESNSGHVYIDEINSSGTDNRTKILQKYVHKSICIQAEDFLALKKDEGRQFTKDHKVIYIYHNEIDAKGDNFKTESQTFKAVQDTFGTIQQLIKQITNFNGKNILITSDHGFIYQNQKLDESDFCRLEKLGNIYYSNRRCVIGKDLTPSSSVKKFKGNDVNLDDDTEILIAKSINRIRIQGSGNRYVHGGASLQEIILPVIQFNKKRESDVKKVNVDIIKNQMKITTNQVGISFIQSEVINEKIRPRELKIGFYAKDDCLLSDEVKLTFDSTKSDYRAREQKHRFIFMGDVHKYSNQTIYLRLQERIEGTTHYKIYKEDPYTLYLSFGSDFDVF